MELLLSETDLNSICRMCTGSLMDQECYIIDTELEEMIFVLTSLKFDHIENKENLRMCVNCFDCLRSFNEFRSNCINIHEKLVLLDLKKMEQEDDDLGTDEFFIEEVSEQPEVLQFKTEEEYAGSESYQNIDEVEYAVEKIIESDDQEKTARRIEARKSQVRETSSDRGKELYKRLLQKCTICGKMVEKNRFEGHINKHNNYRPYSCTDCSKTFYCKQLLRLHKTSIHTNIKIKCDTCDKFFPSARALYAHTRRHENEGRYVCSLCDKKFNNGNSLKRHMAIHSGVREFVCTFCGVGFYRKFNLDTHIKNVHHQTKEFTCTVEDCKKNFGYLRLLKEHTRRIHGIDLDNSEF